MGKRAASGEESEGGTIVTVKVAEAPAATVTVDELKATDAATADPIACGLVEGRMTEEAACDQRRRVSLSFLSYGQAVSPHRMFRDPVQQHERGCNGWQRCCDW